MFTQSVETSTPAILASPATVILFVPIFETFEIVSDHIRRNRINTPVVSGGRGTEVKLNGESRKKRRRIDVG
jgi:hypothetical protein